MIAAQMAEELPESDPNRERRQHPRVDIFQEIACEADGVACRSCVADLSLGGMFIELARPAYKVGTPLRVCFALRPGEAPLIVPAEVNYVQNGIGMGVRFAQLAADQRARIAGLSDEIERGKASAQSPRKSARIYVQVPVRVRGTPAAEPAFDERTHIITLSKHGACIESTHAVDLGNKVLIETPRGREFKGNVVWVGSPTPYNERQFGIQCRGLAQSLGFQFP